MPLRKLVFEQFRENKMRAGYKWSLQQCLKLKNCLKESEYMELLKTIRNLHSEGIIALIPNSPIEEYRLTEKGEAIIWSY